MRRNLTIAFASLAALGAMPAGAADPTRAELGACRELTNDADRLACYDRAVGRLLAQPAAPTPAPAAAAPVVAPPAAATPAAAAPAAAAAASAEDNFGRDRVLAAEETKRREQEARAAGELNATVTAIETRIDGLMTITLDNGQVWRQSRPDSMFRLKVGDPVRIQPGSMKSFIMSGPTKKSTRVSRVE
jgi:hypothetical protein